MATEPEQSPVRADGMPVSKVERELRRMLCLQRHSFGAYMDDGEASFGGDEFHRPIDYMRETPAAIQQAWVEAGRKQLTLSGKEMTHYRLERKERDTWFPASVWLTEPDPSWSAWAADQPDSWRIRQPLTGKQVVTTNMGIKPTYTSTLAGISSVTWRDRDGNVVDTVVPPVLMQKIEELLSQFDVSPNGPTGPSLTVVYPGSTEN